MTGLLGHLLRGLTESRFSDGGEAGRSHLQRRLTLMGLVGFLFAFGFYCLSLLAFFDERRGWSEWWQLTNGAFGFCDSLLLLAMWLVCRRGRRSHLQLNLIDFAGFVLLCWAMVPISRNFGLRITEDFIVISCALILVFRAVIVPSTPLRTMVIGALAALAPITVLSDPRPDPVYPWHGPEDQDRLAQGFLVLWIGFGFMLAAVTSRVLYGLQRRVEAAEELGRYRLEEKLGEGGMGEVYRARHAMLRRPTAVKLLRAGSGGSELAARFEREVQLTASLTHPHTIAIYDYGTTPEGLFYYAMEYLEGFDLETLVRQHGPLPPERVIHLLRQVCESLEEAHAAGLVHRDVKPANIFLTIRGGTPDFVKVLDFGLVKKLEELSEITHDGELTVVGTPQYLAPESIQSPRAIDHRVDLYALGAVGFFMLTGRVVFEAATVMELCKHHVYTHAAFPPTPDSEPLRLALQQVLLRCLAKDPAERPETASALESELASCDPSGTWTTARAHEWWSTASPSGPATGTQPEETAVLHSERTFQIDLQRSR